jgi:trimeric autotransporter adhesin
LDSLAANNGITKTGYNFKLGGTLNQSTTIGTSGTNTLNLTGLTSGNTATDSVMVWNPATGSIKVASLANLLSAKDMASVSPALVVTGGVGATLKAVTVRLDSTELAKLTKTSPMKDSIITTFTANNGLTKTGANTQLGGPLVQATTITTTATNTLTIAGLQSGSASDSVVVADAAGVLKRRSIGDLLSATDTLNSAGNIMTSKVSGKSDTALIITSHTMTLSGNQLTNTVNGVAATVTLNNDSTTASNGLNLVGKDVRMGGPLTAATTVTTTATNTLALTGLQGGTKADSLVVADAATGVLRRRNVNDLLTSSTTNVDSSEGNIHFSRVNNILDSSIIIKTNSLTISGNTITSVVNGVSSNATLSNDDSTRADNGLNLVGKTVKLGGPLTAATTITTTATNTLAVSGLQGGTAADSILVADAATGVMKRRSTADVMNAKNMSSVSPAIVLTGGTGATLQTVTVRLDSTELAKLTKTSPMKDSIITIFTANNGLTKTGNNTQLGGALVQATSITTTATNTLAVSGLQSGTAADSIVVADASTGVLKRRSISDLLSATDTLNSAGNIMTSKVSGKSDTALIINNNTLTVSGNQLTSNVNGVVSTVTMANDSTTASNGLTLVGKDVRLGGTLNAATTIATSGSNTLSITGLGVGAATDSILVMNAAGVVKKVSPNAGEPWYSTATNTGAKNNTDSVYIMGNVGIKTATPNSTLQVAGSFAIASRILTASTTVTAADHTVLFNMLGGSGGLVCTLPAATTCANRIYVVGRTDNNTGRVLTFSENIIFDDANTITTLNFGMKMTIQSDGTNWNVIAKN